MRSGGQVFIDKGDLWVCILQCVGPTWLLTIAEYDGRRIEGEGIGFAVATACASSTLKYFTITTKPVIDPVVLYDCNSSTSELLQDQTHEEIGYNVPF